MRSPEVPVNENTRPPRKHLQRAGLAGLVARKAVAAPTYAARRRTGTHSQSRDTRPGAGAVAAGACLRKLVMICYGVLKNRAPFDPGWGSRKAP